MLVLEFEEYGLYELGVDNEKSHDFTCLVHSPTCQAQPSQLVLSSFSPLRLYSPSDSRPRAAFVNPTRLRLRHPSRRGVTRRGRKQARFASCHGKKPQTTLARAEQARAYPRRPPHAARLTQRHPVIPRAAHRNSRGSILTLTPHPRRVL
eukprot:scaffold111202_cov62-Phaeocystis_antarctica.AAC.2